jgi:hypothetical protein
MVDARRFHVIEDYSKKSTVIKDRNPFVKKDNRLKSLFTGITAR